MTLTYFMQDQVNPAAKVTAIQGWRPSRMNLKEETRQHFSDIEERRARAVTNQRTAHASGYTNATRSGWKGVEEAYPPATVQPLSVQIGELELLARRGLIADWEDVDFIRYMAIFYRLSEANATDSQKNKINELYARYGAKP